MKAVVIKKKIPFLKEENTKSKEKVSSAIYTTEIFDTAQVKLVWVPKIKGAWQMSFTLHH